jgi:hypothetical protein
MPDIKLMMQVVEELLVAATSPPLRNQEGRQLLAFCRDRAEKRGVSFAITVHVLMHGFRSPFGDVSFASCYALSFPAILPPNCREVRR